MQSCSTRRRYWSIIRLFYFRSYRVQRQSCSTQRRNLSIIRLHSISEINEFRGKVIQHREGTWVYETAGCDKFQVKRTGQLALPSLQTHTDTFANSLDPDETACNKPSHQDLHCLPFCYFRILGHLPYCKIFFFLCVCKNSKNWSKYSIFWIFPYLELQELS